MISSLRWHVMWFFVSFCLSFLRSVLERAHPSIRHGVRIELRNLLEQRP